MAKIEVQAVGDAESLVSAFKRSGSASRTFQSDLKQLAVTARQSATAQIDASVKKDARLRGEIAVYREIAAQAKRGSREQVSASNLAARAQGQLARSYGTTARESRRLSASAAGVERQLGRSARGALAGSGAFRSMGRSLAFASAYFLSFAGAARLIRSSIGAAVSLQRQTERVSVLFGRAAAPVKAWARTTANSLGLAREETLRTAADFGTMLRGFGLGGPIAARLSQRLVHLTADLASFRNVDPGSVSTALQRGLAGMGRGLKVFGIDITATRLKAEALRLGLIKGTVDMHKVARAQDEIAISAAKLAEAQQKYGKNSVQAVAAADTNAAAQDRLASLLKGKLPGSLTSAQKALAAYAIEMHDTALEHGFFGRHANQLGEEQKRLRALLSNVREEIGTALLPTTLRYTRSLVDWLSKSKNQAAVTRDVRGAVKGFVGALSGAAALIRPLASAAGAFANAVGGWKNALILAAGGWVGFKAAAISANVAADISAEIAAKGFTAAWRAALISTGWGALAIAAGAAAAYILTHWSQVKEFFSGFWRWMKAESALIWTNIEITALHAYLRIVEPFSHLPGALGGWARNAKERVREQLAQLVVVAGRMGDAAASAWEKHGKTIGQIQTGINQQGYFWAGPDKGWVKRRPGQTPKDAMAEQTRIEGATKPGQKRTVIPNATVVRDFSLPMRFQLEQARADASGTQSAVIRAARDIRRFLLAQIPHLKGQRLLTAYGLLATANNTLTSAIKAAADKAKAAAAAVKQKLQAAIDNVRQQIGQLFQGPVLAPTAEQTKASLGVPGPQASKLTADLNAQVAQYRRLNRDLAILTRRGAPKELVKELRGLGTAALPQIEALAHASRAELRRYARAFGARERLVHNVAYQEVHAKEVTIHARTVVVHGGSSGKRRVVPSQVRGRHAGTPPHG